MAWSWLQTRTLRRLKETRSPKRSRLEVGDDSSRDDEHIRVFSAGLQTLDFRLWSLAFRKALKRGTKK